MRRIKTSLCLLLLSAATFSVSAQNVWTGTSTPTTTTGNVGIGNAAPVARLDINSGPAASALKINHGYTRTPPNVTNIIEVYNQNYSLLNPPQVLINWLNKDGVFGLRTLSNTAGENRIVYNDNAGNLKSSDIKISNLGTETPVNTIRRVRLLEFTDNNGHQASVIGGDGEIIVTEDLRISYNAYAQSFNTFSDRRLKDNIQPLKDLSSRLFNIKPYSYIFKAREGNTEKRADHDKLHFGFIAQEVEKEFPNLVSIDEKGNYALNYIEFIPLLLNELKDQKSEIKDLKERMAALEAKINGASETSKGISEKAISAASFSLEQNVPNPFNRETVIRFNAVGDNVSIGIYDLAGRQLQTIPVKKGEKQISVSASTLTPGTYVYNLRVDGKLIDSKKMIVTN